MRAHRLLLVSALLVAACSRKVPEPGESSFTPAAPVPPDPGPAELQIVDDVVGSGATAKAGDTVRVHYTGTLMNGTKFDSSRDRGTPFDFTLGTGAVIKGWDQGVAGMRVGGKRHLVIPQALAYGPAGKAPDIPARAGMRFEIELLDVNPKDASAPHPPAPSPGMDPDLDPDLEGPPEDETP
jgi:FKBP-type peptidyl-prolyl cis-trans isomerase FkpA